MSIHIILMILFNGGALIYAIKERERFLFGLSVFFLTIWVVIAISELWGAR